MIRAFLSQPYPFGYNVGRKLRTCASAGVFVAVFLGVFQPFGMHAFAPGQRALHAVLFGIVTLAVSSAWQLALPRLLPRVFAEEGWKSWKEILFLLLIVVCVAAGNYWLMQMLYDEPIGGRSFYQVLYMTCVVGVFPVVAIVATKQMLLHRQYAADAVEVNRQIQTPAAPAPERETAMRPRVVLQGEGRQERLELAAGDILSITASDNYVEVFFSAGGAVRTQLLRSSLKQIEQQLSAFPSFFRCHRAVIVNLDLVERVTGNAQGLRLYLTGQTEAVPVSRSLTQTVKDRLAHLSHSSQTAAP